MFQSPFHSPTRTQGALASLLLCALIAGCGGDGGGDGGGVDDANTTPASSPPSISDTGLPPDSGPIDVLPAPEPRYDTRTHTLAGKFEFGQTHMVESKETRIAPSLSTGRNTMVLFTPTSAIPSSKPMFIEAIENGRSLGRYALKPPEQLPRFVESRLTPVDLPSYSDKAWSGLVPAGWVRADVTLSVGYDDVSHVRQTVDAWRTSTAMPALTPATTLTLGRVKFTMFGDGTENTDTVNARKLMRDYFAVMPVTQLRLVDYAPVHWDYMIAQSGSTPPTRVTSDAAFRAAGNSSYYGSLKQWTIRTSMANTGRGLLTGIYGDSSPYSFGTYVGQGRYRNSSGALIDMDDIGAAGGWTGWSAIWWNTDCGNAFAHEVGHSYTFGHFTGGTAANWKIAEEYPKDGTWLPTHPQPVDVVRNAFRTWYKVAGTPVAGDTANGLAGKRDPMNGGERSDAQSCFPPYTAYHARKFQQWMKQTPTLREQDHQAGVYAQDEQSGTYLRTTPASDALAPARVNVPVLTLIGTLAASTAPDARQIYPALYAASGNTFVMPNPFAAGLPAAYQGARYFVEVRFADGHREYTLIPQRQLTLPTDLKHFSMNVALDDHPVAATLYEAAQGYPAITLTQSTALFTRQLAPAGSLPTVQEMGQDSIGHAADIHLSDMCIQAPCGRQAADVTWYPQPGTEMYATLRAGGSATPATASAASGFYAYTRLVVPMKGPDGQTRAVIVRAARTHETTSGISLSPIDTPASPAQTTSNFQRIAVWAMMEDNPDLPAGYYATEEPVVLDVHARQGSHDAVVDDLRIHVSFFRPEQVTATAFPFQRAGFQYPNSSIFFMAKDGRQGPGAGKWAYDKSPARLTALVENVDTHERFEMVLDGYKQNCGYGHWQFAMNDGGNHAKNCADTLVVAFDPAKNAALPAGHYVSPADTPLTLTAHAWHINAKKLHELSIRWDVVIP
ncbi:M66 family metalloprotease [Cupriavidus sp.]|jgi:hypothetical protein|uniref:M66 family metalloprotease n=1 Tax=Cupriavidus sp. TaxID=1873897 RepID=UPI0028BEE4AA|nr:M66 family metalloprotease [Cupriavidus sp.]